MLKNPRSRNSCTLVLPCRFDSGAPSSPTKQSDMTVGRSAHAERLQQHDLTRGVGQMIIAAQHLRDAHGGIVNRVAKKERRRAVFAANDEIADVVGRKSLRPVHRVREFNDLIDGHRKAQRRLQAP